jgi:hypothetical protein
MTEQAAKSSLQQGHGFGNHGLGRWDPWVWGTRSHFGERDFPTCSVVERYVANISSVMADLNLTSIVCHTPNPVAADVAGETVLMSLERSRCYGLGGIGSEIWSKLAAPVRVADLVEEFTGRYEAPPGVIERDVLQLLTQLADEGLIKIC